MLENLANENNSTSTLTRKKLEKFPHCYVLFLVIMALQSVYWSVVCPLIQLATLWAGDKLPLMGVE